MYIALHHINIFLVVSGFATPNTPTSQQLGGLLFLGLLPSGVEEQVAMQSADSNSKLAGRMTLLFFSCNRRSVSLRGVCPCLNLILPLTL